MRLKSVCLFHGPGRTVEVKDGGNEEVCSNHIFSILLYLFMAKHKTVPPSLAVSSITGWRPWSKYRGRNPGHIHRHKTSLLSALGSSSPRPSMHYQNVLKDRSKSNKPTVKQMSTSASSPKPWVTIISYTNHIVCNPSSLVYCVVGTSLCV